MRRPNEKNYRRFRRLTLRILVDYAAEGTMRCDYATTLGAGGLFIETDEPIDAGTRLKMRFRLPGGQDLHELEGRVVWKRGGTSLTALISSKSTELLSPNVRRVRIVLIVRHSTNSKMPVF